MSTTVDAPEVPEASGGTGPAGRWDRATVQLLTALFAQSAGAAALVTVLGKQVYDLSGRALDLGLLGLAEFAPAALLVLVTGTVADRFDRRRVAALGSLGEGLVAVLVTLYAATSPTAVAPLFGLALVFGVGRAFVAPASRSLPADTVPPAVLPWLVARWTIVFQLALIAGPAAAGSFYAVDTRAPFAVSAALFVAAGMLFALLPPGHAPRPQPPTTPPPHPPPSDAATLATTTPGPHLAASDAGTDVVSAPSPAPLPTVAADQVAANVAATHQAATHQGMADMVAAGQAVADQAVADQAVADEVVRAKVAGRWREALEGLRLVRRTPILLGAISLDLFAVLFGGAVALLPAIADERLGVGAVGFGWLRAAPGIGAAAMMLLLAVRPVHRHVGRALLWAVAVFGLATVVLGATTSYVVAFGALVVLAGADALSVFVRITLVPLVTPATARGRVLAVENVFIGASNELGAFESGVTGQLLGPALAVGAGGVATLVVAATWSLLFPALRRVDRFPTPTPTGPTTDAG